MLCPAHIATLLGAECLYGRQIDCHSDAHFNIHSRYSFEFLLDSCNSQSVLARIGEGVAAAPC